MSWGAMCCYDCERGYLLGVKLVTDVGSGPIKKKSMTIAARIFACFRDVRAWNKKKEIFFCC